RVSRWEVTNRNLWIRIRLSNIRGDNGSESHCNTCSQNERRYPYSRVRTRPFHDRSLFPCKVSANFADGLQSTRIILVRAARPRAHPSTAARIIGKRSEDNKILVCVFSMNDRLGSKAYLEDRDLHRVGKGCREWVHRSEVVEAGRRIERSDFASLPAAP